MGIKSISKQSFHINFLCRSALTSKLNYRAIYFHHSSPFSSPRNKTITAKDESGERNFSLLKLDVKMMKLRSQEATENSQREKSHFSF